jgi:hypothetical protein
MTLKKPYIDYAAEEIGEILDGKALLAPQDLLSRWKISAKELKKLCSGTHPSGAFLPSVRFGLKTIRFRLRDVVRVEHELYEREL